MDTPSDTRTKLEEAHEQAEMIRSISKRVYRDMEMLRRLSAQHMSLMADLTDTQRGHRND